MRGALLVAAGLAMLSLASAGRAGAAGSPLDRVLYPAHTQITSINPLSNARMDCAWGFACEHGKARTTAPLFHLRRQADLRRRSGWAQFGDWAANGQHLRFALFASRYATGGHAGLPWNVAAFVDFRYVLLAEHFADWDQVPSLLAKGQVGNVGVQSLESKQGDVLTMVCWTGDIEVEGMAAFTHGKGHALALGYLTRQMRAAVDLLKRAPRSSAS